MYTKTSNDAQEERKHSTKQKCIHIYVCTYMCRHMYMQRDVDIDIDIDIDMNTDIDIEMKVYITT